jgi:hypothetical protein
MSLPDFALVALYALGLRQLIFEYKKTAFIRDFLLTTPLSELVRCVYCQSVECAVLALILRPYVEPVLVVLSVGFVAIAIDSKIYTAIIEMENIRSFNYHENESKDESEVNGETDKT